MPALGELQRGFAHDMHRDSAVVTHASILPGKFSSDRLLQIYRNNYLISLTTALRDIHPTINTLVGDGFFNFAADQYLRKHPSTSGNLHNFGHSFGEFLAQFEPAATLPYLPDVARLDCACHSAFHAADTSALATDKLAADKLAKLAPDAYGNVRFSTAPSLTLLTSPHPLFSIWEMSQSAVDDNPDGNEHIELPASGECLLVHRPKLEVMVQKISRAEFAFLEAIGNAQTLGIAVERAVEENPEFDLNTVLGHYLGNGVLTDAWLDD